MRTKLALIFIAAATVVAFVAVRYWPPRRHYETFTVALARANLLVINGPWPSDGVAHQELLSRRSNPHEFDIATHPSGLHGIAGVSNERINGSEAGTDRLKTCSVTVYYGLPAGVSDSRAMTTGAPHPAVYIFSTNEIGDGRQWYYASPELRAWINSVFAAASARHDK